MGWFSRKDAQGSGNSPLIHGAADADVEAVLTQAVVDAHMQAIVAQMAAEPIREDSDGDVKRRRWAFEQLKEVEVLAHKLDRNRLSRRDKSTLYEIVYRTLPYHLDRFRSLKEQYTSWSTPISALESALPAAIRQLRAIVLAQVDPLYEKPKRVSPDAQDEIEPGTSETDTIAFPNLRALTPAIGEELGKVRTLWVQVNATATAVEDRFTVEQIANSYLPESWQMLASFESMSPQLQEEAEKLLLHQLSVLQQQLSEMLGNTMGSSIAALRAQTDFIEQQRVARGKGSLSLEK